jgi:hypothetical protein
MKAFLKEYLIFFGGTRRKVDGSRLISIAYTRSDGRCASSCALHVTTITNTRANKSASHQLTQSEEVLAAAAIAQDC